MLISRHELVNDLGQLDTISMKENLQINAIKAFKFAFSLLEDQMNSGVHSLRTRSLILKHFEEHVNPVEISHLLDQIDGIESNDRLMAMQFIPAVVLLSFSIELSLKVRLKQSKNIEARTHDLHKLFNMLTQQDKKFIKEKVQTEQRIQSKLFDDILRKNANGFVNWRYFYEKENSSNIEFLKSFLKSIKSIIQNF